MQSRRRRSPLAALLALVAIAVALIGAGCGGEDPSPTSGGSGNGPDPATIVPAAAPIYVEASLRPEGAAREGVLAAARKVTRMGDPLGELRRLLDRQVGDADEGLLGAPGMTFTRDIEPWLGNRVGVFMTNFGGSQPDVATIVPIRDEGKARAAIERSAKTKGVRPGNQQGTQYGIVEGDEAYLILDDFLVYGDEGAVRQAIDARKGASLAESDRFREAMGRLSGDRVASAYADLRPLFQLAMRQDPRGAQAMQMLGPLADFTKAPPIVAALKADGDKVTLDSAVPSAAFGPLGSLGGGGSRLIGQLPGDSWAAYGIPKLGESLKTTFEAMAGGIAGGAIQQRLGLDLPRDVFSWMGDAALFVRGDSLRNLDGGIVIETRDEQAAERAVQKLVPLATSQSGVSPSSLRPATVPGASNALQMPVPQLPAPLVIATGNGRLVIALGERAAAEGIKASQPLSGSALMSSGQRALGDAQPLLLVSIQQALRLAESSGSLSDPDYQQAKPYLQALDVLAVGSRGSDDQLLQRIGVGLR